MASGKPDNVSVDFRSGIRSGDTNLENIVTRLVFKAMTPVQSLRICRQRKAGDQGLSLKHANKKS